MDILRSLVETQGFFLRREALEVGVTDKVLTRGVRDKTWERIRQGAYCHWDIWATLSAEERHAVRAHAAYRLIEGEVALSHVSALVEFGCALWKAPLDLTHVIRRDSGSSRREAGTVHHTGLLLPEDLVERDGRWLTSPARSTVDAATLMTVEAGLVAVDWMLHHGLVTLEELWTTYLRMKQWPNTLRLELTLRLADGRSESVAETRGRHLFWRMGLPTPELAYEIYDECGRLVAICDFAWPEHGVYGEFDGKVKYGRLLKEGQTAGDVVFEEKRREDLIRRLTGGTVVRWTWSELTPSSGPSLHARQLLRSAAA
ncbi:type IV toxin-antitoxin system AbiEi family antitoxin domain-containing protein [Nocardioides sp.]|uniref:type IV toxin-antitoxin system AbiEi family antitoxin domain-containing protein n=1 Tax=Nocardioides sp. TaxID=35761 RepID=UPI0031FE8F0C|nr:hypothetical protein [Nocardioides sp.]